MKLVWDRSVGWNIQLREYKKEKMDYAILTEGAGCYPWKETFVWWHWATTITGKRVWWKKIYKRRVWVVWGNGFHMEPETQYATLFEILADEISVNET